jgi:serine/threonine-protein kinase
LGNYELVEMLARGGMGVVHKAFDIANQRFVAVKIATRDQVAADAVERFRHEARVLARLHHPHILPIYDSGEVDNCLYICMKLLEGGNLRGRVADFMRRPHEAARLLLQVADAVAYAHEQGILHLDLKPSNVLFDSFGSPYVGDFGLAGTWNARTGLAAATIGVGSPAYMAPEQVSAGESQVGPSTDVYGLGAILYELLTGAALFRGDQVEDVLHAVLNSAPPVPRSLNPGIPVDLELIVCKCLEKNPKRRYRSVCELQEDLRRFIGGAPLTASDGVGFVPGHCPKRERRHCASRPFRTICPGERRGR